VNSRPGARPFDVVVVGDLNADLILTGDVVPQFGQVEKLIDDSNLTLGGSSSIFACAAVRLGLRVAFIGKVGDDLLGRFVMQQLTTRGVNVDGVVIDPYIKTGLGVILSKGEDRAILTYLGSVATLSMADVDMSLLGSARHIHTGAYFLLEGLRADLPHLFALAHKEGLSTSLDTNYDPAQSWQVESILPHVDVLLPNASELLAISKAHTVEHALDLFVERPLTVAVKCGGEGGIAQQGSMRIHAPAFPVNVVDTTGAGDTFDAGFIYGHLAGWTLQRCLQFAIACGSLSTTKAGGTGSQPTFGEVEQFLG
jgi:sugar/nucleoside kinase (ribokinase family)